jgi:ubiquinol-cytochrome c reductase cytochrome b subunit
VSGRVARALQWLDSRTGWRAGKAHMLDEPIPAGVGWWFVTGSVLMLLLGIQLVTGVALTLFYVPSPEFAHESVRYIMERLTFGRVLRGLHYFGASFIVVAAIVHMVRVVALGSSKKPREVTWLTGVVLLLVILAFSLTGYLLPWDQKAYWATTVTINIARSAPFGEYVAGLLRGGPTLGSLTLLRWYSAHVFLLPAALIGFVVAHVYLMRRHGISGSIQPVRGAAKPFYPHHALKDTIAGSLVFALLLTFAVMFRAPLDPVADPADATVVPRPEWYFLSLFQLLKYFPGPLEPVATVLIPGLAIGFLLLLPFLDRGTERHPRRRPAVMGAFTLLGFGMVVLTYLGFKDSPVHEDPAHWAPAAIAGSEIVKDDRCVRCHRIGGAGNPIATTRLRKDQEWLLSHVRDPEMIAPGLREPPRGGMGPAHARSVLSFMRKQAAGAPPPALDEHERSVALILGTNCVGCHMIDGQGETAAPDLSRAGAKRDAKWLREWITSPETVDEFATMPAFGESLNEEQLTTLANYLAARK